MEKKKKNASYGRFIYWLSSIGLVPSVTVPFICGLVFSYTLSQTAVVIVLADFLEERIGLRDASAVVNLLDGMSAVFKVLVTHVLQAYTAGRFIVITFCAASYSMGFMLLWVCALSKFDLNGPTHGGGFQTPPCELEYSDRAALLRSMHVLILATVLIALGKAGLTTLSDFFNFQLREKVKNMHTEDGSGRDMEDLERIRFPLKMELPSSGPIYRKSRRRFRTRIGPTLLQSKVIEKSEELIIVTQLVKPLNRWIVTAKLTGIVIALCFFSNISWLTRFRVSSLVMAYACLGFLSGIFWYYPEERPTGSPLTTIYRVFKEALRKSGLAYPSSSGDYYSSDRNHSEDLFYTRESGSSKVIHLSPRDPSFLMFLDKAAIRIKNNEIDEQRPEEVCTVEQVRDVKSIFFIVPLGLTFFAYSVISASGNTYFVNQKTNLDSEVGKFKIPVVSFIVLQNSIAIAVPQIQSRKQVVGPIWSVAVGMFCSVLCCISAGVVERYRLSMVIGKDPDKDVIPLSIMILTPQFFLLGLMKGFAEHGLKTFVPDLVPVSMRKFVDPGIEMLLGIGKFSSILFAFIFHRWIKDSINDSHLDRYFFMLASLSFVFHGIYVCYAKFDLPKLPKFEVTEPNEEGSVGRVRDIEIEVIH